MTFEAQQEEHSSEPQRDERGRFRRGSSGNPYGRPRKQPKPPWSLSRSIAKALAEEVPVTEGIGASRMLEMRDLIVKSLVRAIPKAKPKEALHILERLESLNAFDTPVEEDTYEEIFTEEDRRLLEIVNREIIYCQCGQPIRKGSFPSQSEDNLGH